MTCIFICSISGKHNILVEVVRPPSLTTLQSWNVCGWAAGVGPAWYFSPERRRGEAFNHSDDVWAAGCMLAEMIICQGSVLTAAPKNEPGWVSGLQLLVNLSINWHFQSWWFFFETQWKHWMVKNTPMAMNKHRYWSSLAYLVCCFYLNVLIPMLIVTMNHQQININPEIYKANPSTRASPMVNHWFTTPPWLTADLPTDMMLANKPYSIP